MCEECYKAIKEDQAMFDEYKNTQFFKHSSPEIGSHCYRNGVRLCQKWWEAQVDAPVR